MNDLMLIDKIEKRLKEKRKEVVFPLTPTHRSELRKLKNTNVGGLNDRLRNIEKLKEDEYLKKYKEDTIKELRKKEKIIKRLNDDWERRIGLINSIIKERKILEEEENLVNLNINSDWNDISSLGEIHYKRNYNIDDDAWRKIGRDDFKKKYKDSFDKVRDKILDIETKYEEAINFGDLEIVKELYYMMKTSDVLFEKIDKLDI